MRYRDLVGHHNNGAVNAVEFSDESSLFVSLAVEMVGYRCGRLAKLLMTTNGHQSLYCNRDYNGFCYHC